jgi:hypothetical protein
VSHGEFVAAYQAGRLRVRVDRAAAARFIAGLSLLPLVLLPLLGIAVAVAIMGYFIAGALIFVAALGLRFLVRRSSDGFVVWRALQDAEFYQAAVAAQVLAIEDASTPSRSS